eukprot:765457-Hanusia_phi.AAC.2
MEISSVVPDSWVGVQGDNHLSRDSEKLRRCRTWKNVLFPLRTRSKTERMENLTIAAGDELEASGVLQSRTLYRHFTEIVECCLISWEASTDATTRGKGKTVT